MKPLPIHERFATFQGEGLNMGRAAFFIRTYGCPLHCPWCDAAGTWHPNYLPETITKLSPQQLVSEVVQSAAPLAVITGGEPAIHDLTELTTRLHDNSLEVAIETSGSFPLRGTFDFVTVSPKRARLPLLEVVAVASEIKLIIDSPKAVSEWLHWLHEVSMKLADKPPVWEAVWLHPEWSQRDNREVLAAITEAVKANGDPIRAGYQLHKLYFADAHDARAARAVPLGGVPQRGSSI